MFGKNGLNTDSTVHSAHPLFFFNQFFLLYAIPEKMGEINRKRSMIKRTIEMEQLQKQVTRTPEQ
jgi:hypothetical protein